MHLKPFKSRLKKLFHLPFRHYYNTQPHGTYRPSSKHIIACRDGNLEEIKSSTNVYSGTRTFHGLTDLMICAKNGRTEVIDYLLKFQSDKTINALDEKGRTAFYLACSGGYTETVKFLLESTRGIVYNSICREGRTPFMIACRYGRTSVVREFLNIYHQSGNKNLGFSSDKEPQEETAFHYACRSKTGPLVDLLLESKDKLRTFFDFDKKNSRGLTGYDLWPGKFADESSSKRQRIEEPAESSTNSDSDIGDDESDSEDEFS